MSGRPRKLKAPGALVKRQPSGLTEPFCRAPIRRAETKGVDGSDQRSQNLVSMPQIDAFPTIKQVAERAGVSTSTASRVLGGRGYASATAQERVGQAARELGYEIHLAAQTLKSQSSTMVGVVIQDITNPFYSFLAKGAADSIRRAGLVLLLSDSEEDQEREEASVRLLIRSRVGGVIITPTPNNARALRAVQDRGIPLVQVDRTVAGITSDSVLVDNRHGAYEATSHLIGLGHKDIGVITGPSNLLTSRQRLSGSLQALSDSGIRLDERYIKATDYRRASGYAAARKLLDERPSPTAIFAHNNVLAESLLTVVSERNLRVPADIAVVGFDDVPWARLISPPLTVVQQPAYDIGTMAADILSRRVLQENVDSAPVQAVLRPTLVVRGSCGSESRLAHVRTNRHVAEPNLTPTRESFS